MRNPHPPVQKLQQALRDLTEAVHGLNSIIQILGREAVRGDPGLREIYGRAQEGISRAATGLRGA